MDVPAISSRRLELVSLAPAFLEAVLAGRSGDAAGLIRAAMPSDWPDEHDARFLRLRLEQARRRPEVLPWSVRAVVDSELRAMVGHAGFHGPPGVNGLRKPGAVELGYTTFAAFRGRGFATEAASALVEWARAQHGIRHFVASAAPGNAASLAVLRKLGFVRTGEQWDEEDGRELVFELGAEPAATS